jgi:hypothetical protein
VLFAPSTRLYAYADGAQGLGTGPREGAKGRGREPSNPKQIGCYQTQTKASNGHDRDPQAFSKSNLTLALTQT